MKKSLMDEDLSGLFADAKPDAPKPTPDAATAGLFISLEQIQPDPIQPRKMTDSVDEDLQLLANSIVQHGVLQPIIVEPLKDGPVKYQIIAGERRWRASQMALRSGSICQRKGYDLSRIPVFIRNPESDSDKLEMQMVENLARTGMSDTDISRALNKLISTIRVSKAELARRLGRSETWVKNILTRADPDSEVVGKRIGVPVESIGSNELARLVSWSKDNQKQVILDQIAKALRDGVALSRGLLSDLEEQYDLTTRFPQLKKRDDLTLDDLRTWKNLWDSPDAAQTAVASRVLSGMALAEAMQAPTSAPIGDNADNEDNEDISSDPETLIVNDDFKISDEEAADVAASRSTTVPPPADPARASEEPKSQKSPEEERRAMDVSGMQMESGGAVSVAEQANPDVHVRVPGDMVTRLLGKAGFTNDLTVDAGTVLRAMNLLIGQ